MSRARTVGLLSLVLPFGVLPLTDGYTVLAQANQAPPMEVTTDTPEYCFKLLRRVDELVKLATIPVPSEVINLTAEGQRMCNSGQTRGGIMRVRSALVMMEKSDGSAYR